MSRRIVKDPGRGYPGLKKKAVYLYDPAGKFIKKFDSVSEAFREVTGSVAQRATFSISDKVKNYGYMKISTGHFLADYRIGRDKLMQTEAHLNCPYNKVSPRDRGIQAVNRDGIVIAQFRNTNLAHILTGIPYPNILSSCNRNSKKNHGLSFRYYD